MNSIHNLSRVRWQPAVLVAALCIGFLPALHAQEVSASITGIVTDPSGGVIAGAQVEAEDLDRGVSWATASNETGNYALPRLSTGRYSVRVTADGFRAWAFPELLLDVNQRARLDVNMIVGAISDLNRLSRVILGRRLVLQLTRITFPD